MTDLTTQNNGGGVIGYLVNNVRAAGKNPIRTFGGFIAAWLAFFLIWKVFPNPEGLNDNGMAVLAVVVWASIMWVSEAMPVGITGISVPTLLILTQGIPYVNGKPACGLARSFCFFCRGHHANT